MSGRARRAPPAWRLIHGDALEVLPGLPEGFAQTCVTSPPYWGLRDYGVPPRVWGGDRGCRHAWGASERGRRSDLHPAERSRSVGRLGADSPKGRAGLEAGRFCRRCGGWLGCLGLEPEPGLYVSHLVSVLREVHRALRDDGTLWLVLGDTFAASRSYQVPEAKRRDPGGLLPASVPTALKAKDLVGIPWRVAFALQAEGWWLRSDIVWAKPNPMPESVRDRPTRAHEYVFLLARRRRYFYDPDAIREPEGGRRSGAGYARAERLTYRDARGPRGSEREWRPGRGRNRRSVWEVATQPFAGAHFATFPERLVEPCVLAGSALTACGRCGAPWRRVVSSERLRDGEHLVSGSWTDTAERLTRGRAPLSDGRGHWRCSVRRVTLGFEPGCEHADASGRSTVLDPFCGSGTRRRRLPPRPQLPRHRAQRRVRAARPPPPRGGRGQAVEGGVSALTRRLRPAVRPPIRSAVRPAVRSLPPRGGGDCRPGAGSGRIAVADIPTGAESFS